MIKKSYSFFPEIDESAFIAENASIVGNVKIGKNSSIWYGAVLRAEKSPIIIGDNSNVQDNCIIHVSPDLPAIIGNGVSLGHGVIFHSATVDDNTLIGMGSIVLNNAKIGKNCFIGAGSLIKENMVIPDGMMAFGSPAKIIGPVPKEHSGYAERASKTYVEHCLEEKKDSK